MFAAIQMTHVKELDAAESTRRKKASCKLSTGWMGAKGEVFRHIVGERPGEWAWSEVVRDLRVVCLVIDPGPNGVARLHLHASEAQRQKHESGLFWDGG